MLESWYFLKVKIFTVIKIKKGFKISIGCSLKKYKSTHLLAPFTSTPIIGTNAKKMKDIINNGKIDFISNSVLKTDIINIIKIAVNVKTRCLVKKK